MSRSATWPMGYKQINIEFIAGYKGPYVRKEDQTHAEE